MANSITTDKAREKMVKARAGDIPLPVITNMAFGNGGTNAGGTPIQPIGIENTLKHEIIRKPVDGHVFVNNTTCRYSCRLLKNECVDMKINEIALVDKDGDMVAIKTFLDKGKDGDMDMIFEIDDEF